MNVTTSVTGAKELKFDLSHAIQQAQDESAKGLSEDVKNKAASLFGAGVYANGWTWKREGNSTVVYNGGKQASLSHLLENGHMVVDRNGGQHGFWKPPAQHVAPPYQHWRTEYMAKLQLSVRNIKN